MAYTEQQFKDYIADEVLLAVKGEMQWEHTKIPAAIPKLYDLLLTYDALPDELVSESPIGVDIPAGSTLTVKTVGGGVPAGTTYTTVDDYFADQKIIQVTPVPTGTLVYTYETPPEVPAYRPSSVRAYNAILTETLIRLGVTDISQVTDDRKLRDFGRREAWRHVMWATAGDYDYTSDTIMVERNAGHIQAVQLFQSEDSYISAYYGQQVQSQPATTYSTRVVPVWR